MPGEREQSRCEAEDATLFDLAPLKSAGLDGQLLYPGPPLRR